MQNFDLKKASCLSKLYTPDKSRKGDVDRPIISLIDYLNKLDNYYTTSSCSGRIQILTEAQKKPDVLWLLQSHAKVKYADVKRSLSKIRNIKNTVWLRQENLILHVACRTIEDANKLLKVARDIGLRRSGIIADSNIIIVEICSTEKMDVPIANGGKILVSDKYLKFIINVANKKFSVGQDKLRLLEDEIRKSLK